MVGSFTNIRGGHAYADIVRNSEKKPIRIFLQDGRNDQRALAQDGTYAENRDWFFQNVRLTKALTEKGYDVNYEDHGGATPLSATSLGGHEKMIHFLISKGAQVNRKDRMIGETPLIGAAEMGQLGSVKALLENGADPCLTDKEGHTAEGRARESHHDDIAEYLSSQFHCPENIINPPCEDSNVSVCVHP